MKSILTAYWYPDFLEAFDEVKAQFLKEVMVMDMNHIVVWLA